NQDQPRACQRKWQSEKQIGVAFEAVETAKPDKSEKTEASAQPERRARDGVVRGHMLALRAALDEIAIGVVLLDHELRAQFINRAFRRMWALPDAVAESKPSFVALMYHGRDTGAYEIAAPDMDAYIAERIGFVRSGDT